VAESNVKIDWYKNKAVLAIDKRFAKAAVQIAHRIEERTKVNISEAPGASGQGLIDTGFMINSVYVVTPEGSSYDQANQSGQYENREGQMVERRIAPEIKLHQYAAAMVAVGAEYAIYQEIEHGFFIKAIEAAWGEAGGLIQEVGLKEERL